MLEDKIRLLNLVPVLREIPTEAMRSLMMRATVREMVPNTVILNQDQEVEDLYVIVRGNIKHIRCSAFILLHCDCVSVSSGDWLSCPTTAQLILLGKRTYCHRFVAAIY